MALTIILLLLIIGGVMLMLWAGVALIQDKKYFTSAPKDVQAQQFSRTKSALREHMRWDGF